MNKKRVLVALSGGIDSSISAFLLKEQGFEVVAVTFVFWCTSGDNYRSLSSVIDARKICEELAIQHLVVDCRKRFQEEVVDNFVTEYLLGRTPNPCVLCNYKMKFKTLLETAKENEAESIATGHYVKIFKNQETGEWNLYKAADQSKDQSYFLYSLDQTTLQQSLFPLGNMKKSEVRELAGKLNLSNKNREESQEICFIEEKKYYYFIEKHFSHLLPKGKGLIVDEEGRPLGEHDGFFRYTIGQRKGLNIGGSGPWFVAKIDPRQNLVIVSRKDDLERKDFFVKSVRWMDLGVANQETVDAEVMVRYRSRQIKARLEKKDHETWVVKLASGNHVTPGQAAVFYHDDRVLGGGTIDF